MDNNKGFPVTICQYGEGAAPDYEAEKYAIDTTTAELQRIKLSCHRHGCGGIFEIFHLLNASPEFWLPPKQHIECSNHCGNYLEISYKMSSSKE